MLSKVYYLYEGQKWLDENNIEYEAKKLKKTIQLEDELRQWIIKSNYPIKKFFNTSGNVYKELKLKDKLSDIRTMMMRR